LPDLLDGKQSLSRRLGQPEGAISFILVRQCGNLKDVSVYSESIRFHDTYRTSMSIKWFDDFKRDNGGTSP